MDSKVYQKLSALPLYDQYVPNSEEDKKGYTYDFYQRSNIYWSIDCETDDYPSRV